MSEEKGFTIKDRRIFSEEAETKPKEEPEGETKTEGVKAGHEAGSEEKAPLPEINFSTFVISLNASALVGLGIIEDPAAGKKAKNLPLAKQTIDMLGMLEEKTRGNLTGDEESLLKGILHDLRLMYVREKK